MHNKFIIVDANSTNNSWVLGGSTNWTNPSNLLNDYNNLIFIQDEAIAKAYTLEFEEMWSGVFGHNKLDNTPHKFISDGKLIEVYFSPSDQTTAHIIETIESVDNTLEFGLLSFTKDDIGQAVIDKDIEFGVTVRGIIEQENIIGSEFATLVADSVDVRSHTGVANQFHHKYAIIDASSASADPIVLTGSHNWSGNAENNSDENTLIIHDATIANIYLQEFEKRWGELGNSGGISIYGCTDPAAANYDPIATIDDGSCITPIFGCTNISAMNFDSTATTDDGSCILLADKVDLFFSEYGEGSSNNKYIEIYNSTSNPVDLSSYALTRVSNAPTTVGVYEYWVNFDSAAVVLANDVYIVAHPSSDSVILAQADMTYSVLSNGDDGFALVYGGKPSIPVLPGNEYVILDFVGDFNGDPGSGWSVAGITNATKDHTLVRKCSINTGNTNWTTSAGADSLNSEWTVLANNDWSDIGQHTNPCQSSPVYGCTDPSALNYYGGANIDDGSCVYVAGCTDATACNYDPLADFDDGSCTLPDGCTDANATNYDASALCDDGTCDYVSASCGAITGVNLTDVIHDRAVFNWDDMNDSSCVVDQIRIRYREVGSSSYSNKTMGAPVGNNAPCLNTSKLVLNLTASTQYEYDFKIWYQNGTNVNWHANGTFTTADLCVNATNMTATPNSASQTEFCWTNPTSHEFVRLQYRENVPGSSFSNIGGFGVMAPADCKTKNGLTAGTQYRVMWRTWCNVTGGPYRSPVWDGPVIWDQPASIRLEGATAITNLDVYPNPSKDIFNISFTSESIQDLRVRVMNVIGEVIASEDLQQFIGEYTKQINLEDNAKGIYFLEIETNDGVINKKLILQ
jgi:hypothetical protein